MSRLKDSDKGFEHRAADCPALEDCRAVAHQIKYLKENRRLSARIRATLLAEEVETSRTETIAFENLANIIERIGREEDTPVEVAVTAEFLD